MAGAGRAGGSIRRSLAPTGTHRFTPARTDPCSPESSTTYSNAATSAPRRDAKGTTLHRDADALTERSRRTWGAGDYDQVAAGFRHEAESLVWRLALRRGLAVLDAACGSGNLTIPAARTGATVTGLDLVPALLADAAAVAVARHPAR